MELYIKKTRIKKTYNKANRLFLKHTFIPKQFYNQNFTYFQML